MMAKASPAPATEAAAAPPPATTVSSGSTTVTSSSATTTDPAYLSLASMIVKGVVDGIGSSGANKCPQADLCPNAARIARLEESLKTCMDKIARMEGWFDDVMGCMFMFAHRLDAVDNRSLSPVLNRRTEHKIFKRDPEEGKGDGDGDNDGSSDEDDDNSDSSSTSSITTSSCSDDAHVEVKTARNIICTDADSDDGERVQQRNGKTAQGKIDTSPQRPKRARVQVETSSSSSSVQRSTETNNLTARPAHPANLQVPAQQQHQQTAASHKKKTTRYSLLMQPILRDAAARPHRFDRPSSELELLCLGKQQGGSRSKSGGRGHGGDNSNNSNSNSELRPDANPPSPQLDASALDLDLSRADDDDDDIAHEASSSTAAAAVAPASSDAFAFATPARTGFRPFRRSLFRPPASPSLSAVESLTSLRNASYVNAASLPLRLGTGRGPAPAPAASSGGRC
eukprot:m.51317 g.51317  ORF g.51317 m.51317 type:complete len:455 (+) comp12979_c0_seq1:151-1515(+)